MYPSDWRELYCVYGVKPELQTFYGGYALYDNNSC